jgi:peptidoglycan/xylan/chitin deacetylase (PgdA/CDA1 family)
MKRILKRVMASDWLVGFALRCSAKSLTVLAYHRVRRLNQISPLADSLFGPDEETFASQIAWLAQNTNPLSETETLACITEGKPFPKRATLVTFDDGYRDTFTMAAPVLKRYGVPAICFIPTAPISQREPFWWDEIAWVLKQTQAQTVRVDGRSFGLSAEARPQVIESLIEWFKRSDAKTRKALMEDLRQGSGVRGMPREVTASALMTLQQVQTLGEYGVSVGGHTVNHPILSQLDPEDQERELRDSKEDLERWIGHEVVSVAYPFGGGEHFNTETEAIARKVGFRLGFALMGERNRPGHTDPLCIDRIVAPADLDPFVWWLSMPWLMGFRQRA